jgi:hypothetical protein
VSVPSAPNISADTQLEIQEGGINRHDQSGGTHVIENHEEVIAEAPASTPQRPWRNAKARSWKDYQTYISNPIAALSSHFPENTPLSRESLLRYLTYLTETMQTADEKLFQAYRISLKSALKMKDRERDNSGDQR